MTVPYGEMKGSEPHLERNHRYGQKGTPSITNPAEAAEA